MVKYPEGRADGTVVIDDLLCFTDIVVRYCYHFTETKWKFGEVKTVFLGSSRTKI